MRNREFLQKLVRLGQLRTPVVEHLTGVEGAGLERVELTRRVEAAGGRGREDH